MVSIETKYFGYCKRCRILRASPKEGGFKKPTTDYKFMKTNTIQAIIAAVAAGIVIGLASTKLTGDYVAGLTATLGYLTVGAVVALANIDYRRSQRSYDA